jgi:hypothetical protein
VRLTTGSACAGIVTCGFGCPRTRWWGPRTITVSSSSATPSAASVTVIVPLVLPAGIVIGLVVTV